MCWRLLWLNLVSKGRKYRWGQRTGQAQMWVLLGQDKKLGFYGRAIGNHWRIIIRNSCGLICAFVKWCLLGREWSRWRGAKIRSKETTKESVAVPQGRGRRVLESCCRGFLKKGEVNTLRYN